MTGSLAARHSQPPRASTADAARIGLVERGAPWALAAYAFGAARAGSGSVLLLEGPSGIGKSALMAAMRELARETGMCVLSATGHKRESDFRFGVMLQLLQSEPHTAGEVADAALEPTFDELHGFYRLARKLGETAPLAVLVDDADLADRASLRALLYLAERVEQLPAALILSAGTIGASRAPAVLGELARHPRTRRCRLEPLSVRGTERRLAKRWPVDVPPKAATAIHRSSGGNPFLVDTLAAEFARRGGAEPEGGVAELAPPAVAEWALALAANVDPRGPALLKAVAVLGEGCELRHVSALAGVGPGAAEALDGLAEIGILVRAETLAFAQPVVAAAVERSQAEGEQGGANVRAARLLEREGADRERVADHLLRAARTGSDWVVDCLCVAASLALGRGAPTQAVLYLRRALDEPPPREKRADVLFELGRAEAIAGDPLGGPRLSDAIEKASATPERPRAALEAGRTLFGLGRTGQALKAYARGLELVEPESELAGSLRAGQATALWLKEIGDGRTRRLEPPPKSADTPGERVLLALHGIEGVLRGVPRDEVDALARKALASGALLEEQTSDGFSFYLAVGALAFTEHLRDAEMALTTAIQDAEARGSVLGFGTASYVRALVRLMRGRLREAATDAGLALAAERHGWRLGINGARVVLANVCIEQGALERAAQQVDRADAAAPAGDPFLHARLSARGRVQLYSGDASAALETFKRCGEVAERAGAPNPAFAPWLADAGLATAALGDRAEGERLITAELSLAREFGAPAPIGRALRALASIQPADAALETLTAAVDVLAGSEATLERAIAIVDYGAALRRSGRRREALDLLREGLELAEGCGGAVLVRRARRETNAAGARPRRAALHGQDALTERERQVASLAADGLSNREIAEALVVTKKTVEWHLKHAYIKLEVSSRRELAAELRAGDSGEPPERHRSAG